jgi:predicted regulator of Ras-like GTPase activity (Roadblock/LC7/MglB family)
MWNGRLDFVQHQLQVLVERVPEILWVGLITIDGLRIGYYSSRRYYGDPVATLAILNESGHSVGGEAEDRISAMSAATASLSYRISAEIGVGDWEFSVVVGKHAKEFVVKVDDDTMLVTIVERVGSIDAILTELEALRETLVKLQ